LVAFYEAVIGAQPSPEASGDVRLLNGSDEVLVQSIPTAIAEQIGMSDAAPVRDDSPLKSVFDVASIEVALEAVLATGGATTGRAFSFEGFTRHDVVDPDGNVIQLRGRTT
jgi:predicted enzyme related to lactoylglutathione lyase